ncbi:hypothetical protein DXV76_03720 [Rhodobacteraceae bacterium CCMM004]|nr:hypothetical protein DXV76_03720 [Rhodobacteraceae bacterium CCMM004]
MQLLAGGWHYATRGALIPHHQAALGRPWDALPPSEPVLLVGFMRAIGAARLALGLAALASAF